MGTIYQSIEILSKEKGIDPQIVIDAVKDAMLVAARKHFRTTEDLVAAFNDQTGALEIYGVRKVVEAVQDPGKEISLEDARKIDPEAQLDAELRFPKPTDALGRISAQTAKQVILQKVREAERETVYSEYSNRVGELVNCTIKRIEGRTWWWTSEKPKRASPRRNRASSKTSAWATAAAASFEASRRPARTPGSSCRAALPSWSCGCSNRKFRKFTTTQ